MQAGGQAAGEAAVRPEPWLRLDSVDKRFPGTHAVRQVSLEFFPGEVHAIVGENGAGKSTLMRILAGIYADYEGEIRVGGRPTFLHSPRQARELGIAMVHQELALVPDLSVAENMFLGRLPTGPVRWWVDRREMEKRAGEVLRRLEADIAPGERVGGLSIARQQLVEIARGISTRSRVLILDEPTSSLTEQETRDLFRVIRGAKADGVAVIYISHKLPEVLAIADRITVMRDGARRSTRPVAQWTEGELVSEMVGRRLSEFFPRSHSQHDRHAALEVVGLANPPHFADISLTVRKGEIVGIYGLVGSGRTRLAKTIFGLDPARAGTIRVDGRDVRVRSPRDAIANGIALVPEDRRVLGLVGVLDVAKNMTIASLGSLSGLFIRRDAERERVRHYIDGLGIKASSPRQPVFSLSGGNQQKVVLAKWLATRPALLILDEPTRGIDVGAKAEIRNKIDELAAGGLGILLISSELPEIMGMSDRILVMRNRRLVAEFERAAFSEAAIGAAAIGGLQ
ncbi:MAG TPA: sugar ABC transporter ATP-binding protein [Bauldia sp.]|nr:sugar ABC transporter ATP-binding protein [Bauldia sp.]